MLPLVAKPFIEKSEKSLLKKFPFRSAIGRRREDDDIEVTGLRVESIQQSLSKMFEGAVLPVAHALCVCAVCCVLCAN